MAGEEHFRRLITSRPYGRLHLDLGCFSLYDNLGNTKHCKMKLYLTFEKRKRAPRKKRCDCYTVFVKIKGLISSGKCSLPKTYQAAVLNKLLNQILLRLAASNAPICYYSFIWSCLQSQIFIPCFILDIKCSFNAVHLLLWHLFFGYLHSSIPCIDSFLWFLLFQEDNTNRFMFFSPNKGQICS